MNYIWDMAIKAARQGVASSSITFVPAKSCSPYMELSFEDINTVLLGETATVEINPFYRFCDIFKQMLNINFSDYTELKTLLFDIIMHYLLIIDCYQGLNKREYYAKFISCDIANSVFGRQIQEDITVFTQEELHSILSSIIALYRTSASIHLFKQVVRKVFTNSIIYYRSEDIPEILIYLGAYETNITRRKIDTIMALFLPLGFAYRLYWEKHFGIIGLEPTMHIDNIVIY